MNKKILILLIAIAIVVIAIGIFGVNLFKKETKPVSLTKISLVLDWLPSSYHAPLFLAKERGYFKEEGLDVEFHIPSDPATVLGTVATGKDDFGINYPAEVLSSRAKGIKVVSIMALVRHPLISFATLKESGIIEPKDLAGKKVALPAVISTTQIILDTMLKSQGKSLKDVQLIDVGYDIVVPLISKKVDAALVYWGVEPLIIEKQGFSLNILRVQDYGVPDYYESVFITNEDKIAKNPGLVKRFVHAVKRGYETASVDPKESVRIMKKFKPEIDLDFQNKSIRIIAPLWKPENGVFGWQEEKRWVDFGNWMKENGLISKDLDVKAAFNNSFVENAAKK